MKEGSIVELIAEWESICSDNDNSVSKFQKDTLFDLLSNPDKYAKVELKDFSFLNQPLSHDYISQTINDPRLAKRVINAVSMFVGSYSLKNNLLNSHAYDFYNAAFTAIKIYGYHNRSFDKMDKPVKPFGIQTFKGLELYLQKNNVI